MILLVEKSKKLACTGTFALHAQKKKHWSTDIYSIGLYRQVSNPFLI